MLKHKNKILKIFSILFVIFVFQFINIHTAQANIVTELIGNVAGKAANVLSAPIFTLLGVVIACFAWIIGQISAMFTYILFLIVGYNEFVKEPLVISGWEVIRDFCNMFFVLILLIIAFATILRRESYSIKALLPKLIIMAVLINFSKTICGLILDFSQVITMTFVSAFAANGSSGGNLMNAFGLQKTLSFTSAIDIAKSAVSGGPEVTPMSTFGSMVVAFILLMIACIVIVVYTLILFWRIIMIWILVIISPLAYLASVLPKTQQYASQWWDQFTKNVVVGPAMAFFLWLALTISRSTDPIGKSITLKSAEQTFTSGFLNSIAGDFTSMYRYIVTACFLIAGMMMAQKAGGAAGAIAGKGMAAIKKSGAAVLSGDNFFARKAAKMTGVDLRPVALATSWNASRETSKRKDEAQIRQKSRENFEAGGLRSVFMGMGVGQDYFNRHTEGFLAYKGIGRGLKESFVNPFKRKQYGNQIDEAEQRKKNLEEQKSEWMEKHSGGIEARENEYVSRDIELNNLNAKAAKNKAERAAIKAKKDKTLEDEDRLKALDEDDIKIKEEYANRKQEVKAEARGIYMETNGLSNINSNIKKEEEEIKKLGDQIMKHQKPVAFEARSAYRKDVEEAKSKYKSITNAAELQKALADAKQRGDKYDQIALLEKLSGDGNLNEVLRSNGYKSTSKGLAAYVQGDVNDFGESKGLSKDFSDREKLQILNDLGESEERVGHWEMAKMCGMNAKGEMESLVTKKADGTYDDMRHAEEAYAEIIKMDPQKILNSLNRLAMGGENGSGQFELANLGKMLYKNLASGGVFKAQAGRMLGNTAANLSSPEIVRQLREIMSHDDKNSRESIAAIKSRGLSADGKTMKAGEMRADIERLNRTLEKLETKL